MKQIFKLLFVLPLFVACSKNDDPTPTTKEAIVKVEVTNSGGLANYFETTTLQAVGNISSLNISGTTWDEQQTPHSSTKWFTKQTDVPTTITYTTSVKVQSLTYASVISPKELNGETLTTTVKFYADDKLIKTENITTKDEMKQVSIPFVVGE